MAIDNDANFKEALRGLSSAEQRQLAARFAENVLPLCEDARVQRAVKAAKRSDITEDELAEAFQSAKAASVDSYTRCGHECNWNTQAGHFVAEAALTCLKPAEAGGNAAWEAAMQARMARICETVAAGNGTDNAEPAAQYRIATEFLKH
jgi:3'-phosphoadenosine 5'-phosphosulfate (PAPS) 3'-phosphatase